MPTTTTHLFPDHLGIADLAVDVVEHHPGSATFRFRLGQYAENRIEADVADGILRIECSWRHGHSMPVGPGLSIVGWLSGATSLRTAEALGRLIDEWALTTTNTTEGTPR